MSWKEVEDKAAAARVEKCKDTLVKLLGGERAHQPRVGLCFSGGGWRSMTSGVALLDALSTALDASNTVANVEGVKLFDCFSHAFGLSGGSWCLFAMLAGAERCAFHSEPLKEGSSKVKPTPQDRASHPWLHGPSNRFDESLHKY